jgi:hypothetical protein
VRDRADNLYILRHDTSSGAWELTFFRLVGARNDDVGSTLVCAFCRPDPSKVEV